MLGQSKETLKRRARMLKDKLNKELGKSYATLKDLYLFSHCVWGDYYNKNMESIMKDTKLFTKHHNEYLLCIKYINAKD